MIFGIHPETFMELQKLVMSARTLKDKNYGLPAGYVQSDSWGKYILIPCGVSDTDWGLLSNRPERYLTNIGGATTSGGAANSSGDLEEIYLAIQKLLLHGTTEQKGVLDYKGVILVPNLPRYVDPEIVITTIESVTKPGSLNIRELNEVFLTFELTYRIDAEYYKNRISRSRDMTAGFNLIYIEAHSWAKTSIDLVEEGEFLKLYLPFQTLNEHGIHVQPPSIHLVDYKTRTANFTNLIEFEYPTTNPESRNKLIIRMGPMSCIFV